MTAKQPLAMTAQRLILAPMNAVRTPVYSRTDGTYWPSGQGTIPLPVKYPDNGESYVVINLSSASGADSLDTLVYAGIDLLGGAATFTGADAQQSLDDVLAQVQAQTSNVFDGTVTGNAGAARLVIYRADGLNPGGSMVNTGIQYTATTGGGSVLAINNARWVMEQAGTTPEDGYYIMDALDPGVNVADITTIQSLANFNWLYLPTLHTLHRVTQMYVAGGGAQSATHGTHVFVRLDPPPATSASTEYVVLQMPPQIGGVTVKNVGGAPGEIDGQLLADGDSFDRSVFKQSLDRPVTYDSTGTSFAITTNG